MLSYIFCKRQIVFDPLADRTQPDGAAPLLLVALHGAEHCTGITDQMDYLDEEKLLVVEALFSATKTFMIQATACCVKA